MYKKFEDLTLADNFMFCEVMSQEEIAKEFLEHLFGMKIKVINSRNRESMKTNGYNIKSVRFDVEFVGDEIVYDIEMQNVNTGNLPKRVRYYQSSIDTSYLKSGDKYDNLPDSKIIFICDFDLFNAGYAQYNQAKIIRETGKLVNDGTHIIYLNTKYYKANVSKEVQYLLDYIGNREDFVVKDGSFVSRVVDAVINVKVNGDARMDYMSFQEILQDARQAGRKEERETLIKEFSKISSIPERVILERLKSIGVLRMKLD